MRKMFLIFFYGSIIVLANIYFFYLYYKDKKAKEEKEKNKLNPLKEPAGDVPFRSNPPDSMKHKHTLRNGEKTSLIDKEKKI